MMCSVYRFRLTSKSLISSFRMTLSAIKRSISRRFEWKLSYCSSAFRTFPVSLIHLSREISFIGLKFFESHEFNKVMLKEKATFLTLKSPYLFGPSLIFKNYQRLTLRYSDLQAYSHYTRYSK